MRVEKSLNNWSTSKIKKMREQVARKVDKHIKEVDRAKKERDEYLGAKNIMKEGATYNRRGEIATKTVGSMTPTADQLPKGPRGGRYNSGKGLKYLG